MSPFDRGVEHARVFDSTPTGDYLRLTASDGVEWLQAEDDADGAPIVTYTTDDGAAFVRGVLAARGVE